MIASLKSFVILVSILVFFERSYLVPPFYDVSYPGLNWLMILEEDSFCPFLRPSYSRRFNLKKP